MLTEGIFSRISVYYGTMIKWKRLKRCSTSILIWIVGGKPTMRRPYLTSNSSSGSAPVVLAAMALIIAVIVLIVLPADVPSAEVPHIESDRSEIEAAVARWEDAVRLQQNEEDFWDKWQGLRVLKERTLRRGKSHHDFQFMIDTSWWLSTQWQEMIKAGYPLFDLPPEPTAAALRRRLKSEDPFLRGLAMVYLRVLGDEECLPALIEMMEHETNEYVRSRALYELGQSEFKPALQPMMNLLDATEHGLWRNEIERTIKGFGPSAFGVLFHSLDELDDPEERVLRVFMIGHVGDESRLDRMPPLVFDRLMPLIRDTSEDDRVRGAAIKVLGRFGHDEIIPDVLRICTEENFLNFNDAKDVLQMFGEPAVEQIAAMLSTTETEDATCSLLWLLMRSGAASAAPEISRCLKHSSWKVRCCAMSALRDALGKKAVPLILPLTEDPNERVSHAALFAISEIAKRKFASAAEARAWALE